MCVSLSLQLSVDVITTYSKLEMDGGGVGTFYKSFLFSHHDTKVFIVSFSLSVTSSSSSSLSLCFYGRIVFGLNSQRSYNSVPITHTSHCVFPSVTV